MANDKAPGRPQSDRCPPVGLSDKRCRPWAGPRSGGDLGGSVEIFGAVVLGGGSGGGGGDSVAFDRFAGARRSRSSKQTEAAQQTRALL